MDPSDKAVPVARRLWTGAPRRGQGGAASRSVFMSSKRPTMRRRTSRTVAYSSSPNSAAVVVRYVHSIGMLRSSSMASRLRARELGAVGTYLTGIALCIAVAAVNIA